MRNGILRAHRATGAVGYEAVIRKTGTAEVPVSVGWWGRSLDLVYRAAVQRLDGSVAVPTSSLVRRAKSLAASPRNRRIR